MNIILGASGQVGSAVANYLVKNGEPVKAIIRNPEKTGPLEEKGIKVGIANYFDLQALKKAVKGGELIFLITPESPQSDDLLHDTQIILENYRKAIEGSKIKKVVGLSSIGAQHKRGTGNFLMSHMLEHTFTDLSMAQMFIRPAYYYSNWILYLPVVKEQGILPTFFPEELQIPMLSPLDLAKFIAGKISEGIEESRTYELVGPKAYSSNDIADIFGDVLERQVQAQQIPREQWKETLLKSGFTNDAAENLMAMTDAVISEKAIPEGEGTVPIKLQTKFKQFLKENIRA